MNYLLLATCSSAVMAIVLRIYQNSKGNRYAIILGNYLICILISWFSLPNRSMDLEGSPASILCGIIGGAFFVAGLVTMLANGGGSSMSKIFEQVGTRNQDELYFFNLFFTAAVLTARLLLLEWKRTGKALKWSEMAAGIAVGIPNYYASFLLLLALVVLPAIIVYPINSTGSILIVMAVDALVFHQKYTKRQWLGILLVLAAMVLLNV